MTDNSVAVLVRDVAERYNTPDWLSELLLKSERITVDVRERVITARDIAVYDLIGVEGVFPIDVTFSYEYSNISAIVLLDNDPVHYIDGGVTLYEWINGEVKINLNKQGYPEFLSELKRVSLELLERLRQQLERDRDKIVEK